MSGNYADSVVYSGLVIAALISISIAATQILHFSGRLAELKHPPVDGVIVASTNADRLANLPMARTNLPTRRRDT